MHLKYLYGPKNNKGKAFILNLLKEGGAVQSQSYGKRPQEKVVGIK